MSSTDDEPNIEEPEDDPLWRPGDNLTEMQLKGVWLAAMDMRMNQ